MRVRYSFSSRKTGRAREGKNIRKQRAKYPALLRKIVETSDIILEVLDARFIKETRNKEIEKLIKEKNKQTIYVLNKSDLIKNKKIISLQPYVYVSAKERTGIKKLRDLIKEKSKKIKSEEKIKIGVIGYPNTGKSSIINSLTGKASAKTGAEAGFTKGIQKLRLSKDLLLLDSPGVIPTEEYSGTEKKAIAKHVKVSARDYSKVKDPESIIFNLMEEYPNLLEKHYKINAKGNCEILLEKLGRKWNFLKKGNQVNFDKTARNILKHWQQGGIKL